MNGFNKTMSIFNTTVYGKYPDECNEMAGLASFSSPSRDFFFWNFTFFM